MSELLTPGRGVSDVTSGRFLTAVSSLSLAETSTTCSLVAPSPLDGVPELSALHWRICYRNFLANESLSFL
jgi:hypothetical protein